MESRREPSTSIPPRPYKGYGTITYDERNGNAAYHALQTSLSRRYSNGFFLQASYTWSKAMVYSFGQNPFVQPNEAGLSSYDQPHNFTFSYVYTLPFFSGLNGFIRAVFGGWETSGNATLSSGFPVTVTVSGDRAGTGSTSQRPNVAGPLDITGNVFGYFNTLRYFPRHPWGHLEMKAAILCAAPASPTTSRSTCSATSA